MNIRDTFLASFSTEPHIYKNALPEQLLGQIYPDTVFLNTSMSILAGGTVEAFAPLSYDIKGFSSYLLLFTQSGSGTLTISNQIYTLSENTLLFLDCRKPYKLNISTTVWTFQVFYLTGSAIKAYYKCFHETGKYVYNVNFHSCIHDYINKLLSPVLSDDLPCQLATIKWLTDIFTEICISTYNKMHPDESTPKYMLAMKQLLDFSYTENFSLSNFEERFCISKYRLCREFSHYFGHSPLQYLNMRRIDVAKDLLLTTDMPVHEIGSSVGIDNTNHFINLFKKYTGTTPFVFKQEVSVSIRVLHYPYRPDVPQ